MERSGVEGLTNPGGTTHDRGPDHTTKDTLKRLALQVKYLQAENDFLAQLRAKRAESNSGRIKAVFDKGKGKYGWRSVKMRLPHMNHKKIQRIMRKYGLLAKVRRRNPYKAIMKKRLEHRVFPNTLNRAFDQTVPFTVFCTDITYIPFQSAFAYLSVVKDIASGEVVAWNLSNGLEETLVLDTTFRKLYRQCAHRVVLRAHERRTRLSIMYIIGETAFTHRHIHAILQSQKKAVDQKQDGTD